MATKKEIIRGQTWNLRLFFDEDCKASLIDCGKEGVGDGKDLSAYTCQIAVKKTKSSATYYLDPVTGTANNDGYLTFQITEYQTWAIPAGSYEAEILWYPTDLSEDYHRYQFTLKVVEGVIDLIMPTDTQVANFAGKAGVTVTVTNQGSTTYFVEILAEGNTEGKLGDVGVTVNSATSFTVYNSGSWRGQFKYRIRR